MTEHTSESDPVYTDDDGNCYLTVVTSNPASNTAIGTADYDLIGDAINNPTKQSNDVAFNSGITNGEAVDWTLNAIGIGNISKTGVSKFGMREGHDIEDDMIADSSACNANWSSADFSGTASDPKIVIEHESNSAPTGPTALQTEGQTHPTNVEDSTPEFSAVFNDANINDLASHYRIQVSTSSSFTSTHWDSGTTTLASSTPVGQRSPQISYAGSALASSTTYYWRIAFSDQVGATGLYSTSTATFTLATGTNYAPSVPTSLLAEGQTNPTGVSDNTPEFSALYTDQNVDDSATNYRIQISTSSSFASVYWDSGTSTMATTTQGNRSPDLSYAGTALASSTTYYWRIKFSDDDGATGAWSTETATFSLRGEALIQDLNFTYDANGNITAIEEVATTSAERTVTYTYDDLNRLLTASSTGVGSGSDYNITHAYNGIGNITFSDQGSYSYSGSGYANPHAATTIGSKSLTYDNNGNTLTQGSFNYTWDFLNRLSQAATGTATTTYQYTAEGKRFLKLENSSPTYFLNDWYTYGSDGTAERRLMLEGELMAVMKTKGGVSTTTFQHLDHLGSTEVVTDTSGNVVQTLDYLPYGKVRVDQSSSGANERKRFTGYEYDPTADLSYAKARYYGQNEGRFLSQDPVFQNLGVDERTKAVLVDPQGANSYSYSRNNPLRLVDPDGEWAQDYLSGRQSFRDFRGQANNSVIEFGNAANQLAKDSNTWNYAFEHPVETSVVVAVGGGAAAYAGAGGVVLGTGFNGTNAIVGGLNAYGVGLTAQAYLQYRATQSQTARNQAIFDSIVTGTSLIGTAKEKQALNILSATLTALGIDIGKWTNPQSNEPSKIDDNIERK